SSKHPNGPALAAAIDGIRGRGVEPEEAEWVAQIEASRERFATAGPDLGELRQSNPQRRDATHKGLAQVSSVQRPWGVVLLLLLRGMRPASCLEVGTAIGISTAYQGAALELNGAGSLHAIDSSRAFLNLTAGTLAELHIGRVDLVEGRMDE